MPTTITQESGHHGILLSLGGKMGVPGRGRQLKTGGLDVTTTGVQLLDANSNRISAILQNRGTDIVYLELGATGFFGIQIYPGQSFQIDQNFPWTGAVFGYVNTTTSPVNILELSVP